MHRRQFLTIAAASAATSVAIPQIAHAMTGPDKRSDIALLRDILISLHPGLYRYASPKQIDAGLDGLERDWASQDMQSRFLSLARFLAMIKCGHSYPNFFNQKREVQSALFDPEIPYRLPFTFRWLGTQMVVAQNQTKDIQLPPGSIVKAINGVSVGAILRRLMPYVRADGNNDAKRRALLSPTGADAIETFDVFYGLVYGPPRDGVLKVRYRAPNTSRDLRVDMKPISWGERKAFMKQPDTKGDDQPIWQWTMRPDGIAVLTMDGWALFNSKWDWQSWLNERLDSLNSAKGLIVDIRENEGGNDCGDLILSRLSDRDIVPPPANRLVRYARVPEHLNPYLDTWDDGFRDWSQDIERFDDRFYLQKGKMSDAVIAARGPRISVPMVVLTSPQNSSATFQFASLAKSTGLGTLIGETTGGNRRGINGGAFFFARLPESGLEFDVPLIGYFPPGPTPPDAGVEPDILISRTAKDYANGTDLQMAAAIAKLKA